MTQLGICYIVIAALAVIAIISLVLFITTARGYSRYRKETEPLLESMIAHWETRSAEHEKEQW